MGFGMGVHAYDMGVVMATMVISGSPFGRASIAPIREESRRGSSLTIHGPTYWRAGHPSIKPSEWARKVQPRPSGHVRSRTLPWQVRK